MARFLSFDTIDKNQTNYWFGVYHIENSGVYGLHEDRETGDFTLLDHEGYPIDDCNDHDGIKAQLIEEWEKLPYAEGEDDV